MKKAIWLIALLTSSCAFAADSDRAALEATVQRWTTAVSSQDLNALKATMTEDVQLLDGTTTVEGRDAFIRALRELTIVRDVAWCVGGFTQMRKNGDVHALGQSLGIWKRVKGNWRLFRLMAPGLIAPPELLTRPPPNEPVLDRPTN